MKINVRRLLFVLLASSLIVHAEDIRSFTILHTNDLHAHLMPDENGLGGFAYIAAEVKHQREGCAACIYLDGGDLVQGSPVSSIFHGTRCMNWPTCWALRVTRSAIMNSITAGG